MDPITLALGLASAAPSIIHWLTGSDKAAEVAQKVVDTAEAVTGKKGAEAVDAIRADPQLQLQFQQMWMQQEQALWKEETARLESVNQTMREEAKSEDPWTRRWRPFWGFTSAIAFAFCSAGIIGLATYGVAKHDAEAMRMVPELVTSLFELFGVPAAILGIASWHRGKMQRVKAGEVIGK